MRKNGLTFIAAMLGVAVALSGCYTMRVQAPSGSGAVSLSDVPQARKTGHFKEKHRVWYALWGLVPMNDETTDAVLADKVRGQEVSNLSVTMQVTPLDVLISLFTGIATITSQSMIVEGDLVQKEAGDGASRGQADDRGDS